MDRTSIVRCALEGATCTCTGTAYFGPASLNFPAMLAGPHASKPARTRISCTDEVFGDPKVGPKQCFCVSTGGTTTIYFSSAQGGVVYALDSDGSLHWKEAMGNTGQSAVWRGPSGDDLGNVYFGWTDGVYAYRHDLTLIWKYKTGGEVRGVR